MQVYNDACVRSLICFVCARVYLDSGSIRSPIEYYDGDWLLHLPRGSSQKKCSKSVFEDRYQQHGSPLAFRGRDQCNADFSDWQLRWHPELIAEASVPDVVDMASSALLCCLEDHRCARDCSSAKFLCRSCEIPICRSCALALKPNQISTMGLMNNNFYGYLDG